MRLKWKKTQWGFKAETSAKMVGELSEKVFTNTNNKNYKLCTIELIDGSQVTAMVYKKNWGNVTPGNRVEVEASVRPEVSKNALFTAKWDLAERVSAESLGFDAEAVDAAAEAVESEVAEGLDA